MNTNKEGRDALKAEGREALGSTIEF